MNQPMMSITCVLLGVSLCGGPIQAQSGATETRLRAEKLATSKMTFIENRGQWDRKVVYRMTSGPATCWFVPGGWVVGLEKLAPQDLQAEMGSEANAPNEAPTHRQVVASADFAMRFENSGAVKPEGVDALSTIYHWSRGSDSSRWVRDARGYRSLRYKSIYPGIDVVIRERDGRLAYDLRLRPGAQVDDILISIEGVRDLSLAEDGSMTMETESGDVRQTAPVTWSLGSNGTRRPHVSSFRLLGKNRYGFDVKGWDGRSELVIDPGLDWGSFLGGSAHETILKIDLDDRDRIAVVGLTGSLNFPKALNKHRRGFNDAYITLIDPSLAPAKQVLWTHYLGGSSYDIAFDVDCSSNLYTVVGYTASLGKIGGYPTTTSAIQGTYGGGPIDGCITQLNAKGAMQYSSYFGSLGNDRIMAVKTGGPGGLITVAGYTNSKSFRTTVGVYQPKLAGRYDAFVARINPKATTAKTRLPFSTFFGGLLDEGTWAWRSPIHYDRLDLHVARNGDTTLGLYTTSQKIKTRNAMQTSIKGLGDIFIARMDFKLSKLLYGSYVGSSGDDFLMQIQVDQSGVISAAGGTSGTNFGTTTGAFQPTSAGGWDCVFFRIDPGLTPTSQLLYSTYVGGAGVDYVMGMTTESSGVMTACGVTNSSILPWTVGAWKTTYPSLASSTGFVLRLDPKGGGRRDLHYLSYLGAGSVKATGWEYLSSIALTRDVYAVVGGSTDNPTFPLKATHAGFRAKYAGNPSDCVLVKMDLLPTWVLRHGKASPGCVDPIWLQVNSQPTRPNPKFEVICNQAPPKSAGLLVIGTLSPKPLPILGINLYAIPIVVLAPTVSDKDGTSRQVLPVPGALPRASGIVLQWIWIDPKRCKGGILSASHALQIL